MATPLHRVVSVKQSSAAATALPLELMQHVFSYLDIKSFFAASKTCVYWAHAATDTVPLVRQLRKLPIYPPVSFATSDSNELRSAWEEAMRNMMVSIKTTRQRDEASSQWRMPSLGSESTSLRIASARGAEKMVCLEGRSIDRYDMSGERPICTGKRPLNDLKETIGNGPWLKAQSNDYTQMALSSNGTLLAVAQERTVQIYDLNAEPDSFTVNEYVPSATGHYICGLDFEQDDFVLRVRLSGKGTVLYLGTPSKSSVQNGQKADIEHWKSRAGLKHAFLDSSLLTVAPFTDLGTNHHGARISGLQLLRPFRGGYLFAGQRHGGGESSQYILGYIETGMTDGIPAPRAVSNSIVVLARLETFLSSLRYTTGAETGEGLGLSENMPVSLIRLCNADATAANTRYQSAPEHHPQFAMAIRGGLIAVAERDQKSIRLAPSTRLFVYRIPSEDQLRTMLEGHEKAQGKECLSPASLFDKLDGEQEERNGKQELERAKMTKYTVPRIPLCLSTVHGEIENLSLTQTESNSFLLSATATDAIKSWRFEQW